MTEINGEKKAAAEPQTVHFAYFYYHYQILIPKFQNKLSYIKLLKPSLLILFVDYVYCTLFFVNDLFLKKLKTSLEACFILRIITKIL